MTSEWKTTVSLKVQSECKECCCLVSLKKNLYKSVSITIISSLLSYICLDEHFLIQHKERSVVSVKGSSYSSKCAVYSILFISAFCHSVNLFSITQFLSVVLLSLGRFLF